ncbi:MAG TPA: division/cell wall cluster transcriptional repressor MraZ [Allosphingosinicella sp.]|nr:division/cell wall cluster transcriptional repressor MraZ [Allosphingosinicella sp.]
MYTDSLFSGNALRPVDGKGRTYLPDFVLRVLEGRRSGAELMLGPHEADPCLSGYDPDYQAVLHAEIERRRIRDEDQGGGPAAHHVRLRRTFGAVERAAYNSRGRLTLPPMIRRRGRIGDAALFIGAGGSFEIWNPDLAREAEDEEVRELARFALRQSKAEEREIDQ